jgi:predicted CoA-binding protein
VSIYLQPEIALGVLPEIAMKKVSEVWLNPGVDTPEVIEMAHALGLKAMVACSILAGGGNPHI